MQSYKRKITYFYQHHNGNIGSTAGFLKLEIRGDKVKIIINIQESPGLPYKEASLYFYHEAGDHLSAIKVGTVESINGMLTYQNRTDWQQMFDTGRDLYTFDGVAVVYNESHYYIGDFQDKSRKDYALVCKESTKAPASKAIEKPEAVENKVIYRPATVKRMDKPEEEREEREPEPEEKMAERGEKKEEIEPETFRQETQDISREAAQEKQQNANADMPVKQMPKQEVKGSREAEGNAGNIASMEEEIQEESGKDVYEKCENCPYHKKRMEQKEHVDAFEKMIAEYPKLPMYGVTELFDCVRIHPKDIGKLDMRNWKLGVNSFLTHGYYTYQYLLLGKMRFDNGSERAILGVPGVYSNREKYLANMFGFEQFIPIKKNRY